MSPLIINLKDRLAERMNSERKLSVKIQARDVCSQAGAVWRCGDVDCALARDVGHAVLCVCAAGVRAAGLMNKQTSGCSLNQLLQILTVLIKRLPVTSLTTGSQNTTATAEWAQEPRSLRRAMKDFNFSENKPLGKWT
jgi:hypothetical protein